MKYDSLERYGISFWKLVAVSAGAAASVGAATLLFAGRVLGGASGPVVLVISAMAFYGVASAPRRMRDSERVAQARDAVLLTASARACLGATGSRAKTLLLLRPREETLREKVAAAARGVLLGFTPDGSLGRSAMDLASTSASEALRSVGELSPDSFDGSDEEARGLASSGDLNRETRLPLFMTVCFFAPMLLLMYAIFSRAYDPQSLAALCGLEFVVVDLAFFLSSYDEGRP